MRINDKKIKAQEGTSIKRIKKISERTFEHAKWAIRKFANEADRLANKVYTPEEAFKLFGTSQICPIDGNGLLEGGINALLTNNCSSGGTLFDVNSQLGVGDGNTAFDETHTGLQGANKTFKAMDSGYPTYGTSKKSTWKATFGPNEANHAWNEFTVRNGGDGAVCLNRKVEVQGTKTVGQTWELTLEIELGNVA